MIELKKGADAENICNLLYKKTRLEDTFGVNMLAVADGRPETMGIVRIIRHSVRFQFELATRKYTTLLNKEREKQEIQEGLIRACDVIDLIIEILRGSKNVKQAKACLVDGVTDGIKFKSKLSQKTASMLRFTERQAAAILEMRLYKLIGLEIEALIREHEETLKHIAFYEKVLGSRAAMAKVLMQELKELKKEFAVPRKTVIENAAEAVYEEKKQEAVPVILLMDRFGYVRSVDESAYERNREAADAESRFVVSCMSDDKICLFTDTGRMHLVKMEDVPAGKFRDRGLPGDNICNCSSCGVIFISVLPLAGIRGKSILFVTKSSMIKRVNGTEFDVSKRTTAATKLADGDSLICAGEAAADATLVLKSDKNYFLRLAVSEIPEKKKGALGVRGMRLSAGESLDAAWILQGDESPSASVNGKDVVLNRLRIGNRDTRGVKR